MQKLISLFKPIVAAFLLVVLITGCRTETEKFISDITGNYDIRQNCTADASEIVYSINISEIDETRILIDNFGNLEIAIEVNVEESNENPDNYDFLVEEYSFMQNGEELIINGFGSIYRYEPDLSKNVMTLFYEIGPENEIPLTCIGLGYRE